MISFWNHQIKAKTVLKNDFVPSKELIEQNLRKLYKCETMNEQQHYMINKPSLLDLFSGVNLNCKRDLIKGDFSFTVGYNFMQIITVSRAFKRYRAGLIKINNKINKDFQIHLQILSLILEELKKRVFVYNKCIKIFDLKKQLFQIEQLRYKNGELKPSEFLKKKIIFEHDKLRLDEMELDLIRKKNEILLKSKGSLLTAKIPLDVSIIQNHNQNDNEETYFRKGQ